MEDTPKGSALKEKALSKLTLISAPGTEVKNTYSYEELHELKDEEQKFLIPELIPSNAVAGLIGEDGIGKTQLCIQLCLHIAMKRRKFLGLELNAIHHRCLIVATEDSRQKFTKAITKQAYALNPDHKPKDILIDFTEGGNFDEIATLEAEIVRLLKVKKYDLVVLDAFSDLFTMMDGEINSNSDARKILSMCQQLCNKYETTLIFIHHAAKTKIVAKRKEGKLFLEKNDTQGAGAISQKPRTILALTHDDKSIREEGRYFNNFLHVLKANLMSKLYVTQAIQLEFDTTVLLHTDTGFVDIQILDSELQQQNADPNQSARKPTPNEIPLVTHLEYVNSAFGSNQHLSRKDLVNKLKSKDSYDVGENKLQQKGGYLEFLTDNGIIVNFNGIFRKASTGSSDAISEEAPF